MSDEQPRSNILTAEAIIRSWITGFWGIYVIINAFVPKSGTAILYIHTLLILLSFCLGISYIILYFTKIRKITVYPKRFAVVAVIIAVLTIGYGYFAAAFYLPDVINGPQHCVTDKYMVSNDNYLTFYDHSVIVINNIHNAKISKTLADKLKDNPIEEDDIRIKKYEAEFWYYPNSGIVKDAQVIY